MKFCEWRNDTCEKVVFYFLVLYEGHYFTLVLFNINKNNFFEFIEKMSTSLEKNFYSLYLKLKEMTIFICSICQKQFKDASGLSKHLLLKKTRCDGTIDTDYWLRKQIPKIHERYKYLKMISDLPDDQMDFETKKKILKAFFLKTNSILKVIEENRNVVPSVTEEDVDKLKTYVEACKTGVYN